MRIRSHGSAGWLAAAAAASIYLFMVRSQSFGCLDTRARQQAGLFDTTARCTRKLVHS